MTLALRLLLATSLVLSLVLRSDGPLVRDTPEYCVDVRCKLPHNTLSSPSEKLSIRELEQPLQVSTEVCIQGLDQLL